MIVKVDGVRKKCAFSRGTVSELLRKLGVQREEALVKVNGALVPEDSEVGGKDQVEVIKVVFGG